MSKVSSLLGYWLQGIRIYIAFGTIVISAFMWWWGSVVYGSGQLRTIRIQEVFAWLSLGYLFITLMIGPVTKIFPKIPGKFIIWDSRRALGLSAAWYALLHALVVYIVQFQAVNPLQLPTRYQIPSLFGVIALFGLLIMAGTSVNAIMKSWGIWWFRVHRVVYVVILLGLIHAFMIGAHASSTGPLIALSVLALVWMTFAMAILFRSQDAKMIKIVGLGLGSIALVLVLCFGLMQNVNQAKSADLSQVGHGH